jgi:hypothetical protein
LFGCLQQKKTTTAVALNIVTAGRLLQNPRFIITEAASRGSSRNEPGIGYSAYLRSLLPSEDVEPGVETEDIEELPLTEFRLHLTERLDQPRYV